MSIEFKPLAGCPLCRSQELMVMECKTQSPDFRHSWTFLVELRCQSCHGKISVSTHRSNSPAVAAYLAAGKREKERASAIASAEKEIVHIVETGCSLEKLSDARERLRALKVLT